MDDITIMWDTAIPTAKTIGVNRLVICFRNNKTNVCLLIDISCPVNGNIAKKEDDQLTEYSVLKAKVSCMWLYRAMVVRVVWGALSTVKAGMHGG